MSTTSRRTTRPGARLRKTVLGTGVTLVLAGMNMPAAIGFTQDRLHDYRISRPEYRAEYGSWALVDVPERYRTNAIHAALLHTGKVMLIAGSGNSQEEFDAGTFETVLWDPSDNTWTAVETPDDLFCAGHSQLADGRLLVAGGTARYELLGDQVTHAGGAMIVKNEDPDREHTFPAGTVFRSPDGVAYRTEIEFTLPPAEKEERVEARGTGEDAEETTVVEVTASEVRVFVVAVEEGEGSVTEEPAQYSVDGLTGEDARNVYGLAEALTLDDQDFHGIKAAYEFDPVAERYIPVAPMAEARWYPTLTTLPDGRVLTVSGLDDIGQVVPGINEIYDPETQTWQEGPERYFPTYPALFLAQGGKIFYTGSNAGYGPADEGREPGIWDLETNTFTEVGGLRDADQLETSASLLLPPAQEQRFMVLGGGGVGESEDSTPRTAVIDLTEPEPRYRDAAELPQGTRYLNSVIMPDDTVFTTGGSEDYRGRGKSDVLKAQFYDPATDTFQPAADPTVPRNYHAEALLLPDGRVATFGSDPLFADADNTRMGRFEQRVEVYTPPALHRAEAAGKDGAGGRPVIEDGPRDPARGAEAVFRVPDAERIEAARLIRPSAVTHTTDVEQRSIAVEITAAEGDELTLDIPGDRSLTPPGWYMLFVVDGSGAFSEAHWVHLP
ncbi:kelch motif-containing protein [Streptomyces calidiresistens]|uniref:DUF1929 domain-containing protein n=1 Tax=Streptomyces calidiresistens TaxID=1485586 RepID=A0A7W3XX68_9ACTN|nr:galactose oxidase-like domain-containing protein [Streptomyces calidiresistens]MBB0230481.1 DUF1929 domain-containing protein [Streptomyces calidiresistens]